MPDRLGYDPQARCLHVGEGVIEHVTPRMWEYNVSEVNVLGKWFQLPPEDTRSSGHGRASLSPLLEVQSRTWRAEYTHDLIGLLNVLGLLEELEPRQAELLDAVLAGPLVNSKDLPTATTQSAGTSAGKRPADTAEATTEPLF